MRIADHAHYELAPAGQQPLHEHTVEASAPSFLEQIVALAHLIVVAHIEQHQPDVGLVQDLARGAFQRDRIAHLAGYDDGLFGRARHTSRGDRDVVGGKQFLGLGFVEGNVAPAESLHDELPGAGRSLGRHADPPLYRVTALPATIAQGMSPPADSCSRNAWIGYRKDDGNAPQPKWYQDTKPARRGRAKKTEQWTRMALDAYRKKRHFAKTPEPSGAQGPADVGGASEEATGKGGLLYVIQKHAARRLHYDFRLELDGVLLSWAVPKGPSLDPHDRHLAARVEDHPLEYGGFEGTIPKGEYGGGTVELWDRGTWEPEGDAHEALKKGDLKFTLHGEKLQGSWVLVRMKPRPGEEGKENWLLIKHRDDYAVDGDGQAILRDQPQSVASGQTLEEITAEAGSSVWHGPLDPSRVPGARSVATMPRFVQPQLATLVKQPPEGDQWLHEIKFDGYRVLSRIEHGSVKMYSRNDNDWTSHYRVLVDDLAKLPVEGAMLDGEVVVQLPDGTTSFQELQNVLRSGEAVESRRPSAIEAAGGESDDSGAAGGETAGQLLYYVFDLLYLNGYELLDAGIEERKELLKRLLARRPEDGRIRYSDHISGSGPAYVEQACRIGLEGLVSKRAGAQYQPGARGGDWLKTKCWHEQEFVVGGFTDPAGTRVGFGALLLGVYENGRLQYVGKVGTGFNEKLLRSLADQLRRLEIADPSLRRTTDKHAQGRSLGRATPGRGGGLRSVDSGRPHPPPQFQGPARR